jgi:phosphinothricin acetyltransferase
VGKGLYAALFDMLQLQGYRNVYAVINLPNDRSVALHEKCGFEYFASYEEVGYKLGKWKTVGWWRLKLNSFGPEPEPPVTYLKLDTHLITNTITKAETHLKL